MILTTPNSMLCKCRSLCRNWNWNQHCWGRGNMFPRCSKIEFYCEVSQQFYRWLKVLFDLQDTRQSNEFRESKWCILIQKYGFTLSKENGGEGKWIVTKRNMGLFVVSLEVWYFQMGWIAIIRVLLLFYFNCNNILSFKVVNMYWS